MPGDGRTLTRTIAVVVLMGLATIALRGYLPGSEPPAESREPDGGAGSLVAVTAMLAVSIAIIAIAIIGQARRRPAHSGASEPIRRIRGGQLRWRPLLIAAVALLAWVALILVLSRWASSWSLSVDQPPAQSEPDAAPQTGADAPPPDPPDPTADGGGLMFGILATAAVVLLVMAIVATLLTRRRVPAPAPGPEDSARPVPTGPADPDLARAAELGLAEIGDLSRDPRDAIIACYLAMERELGKSPGTVPQDSDTPTEVLERAVEGHVLQAGSATELVDLFEEARFSRHVMDEGHRGAAVRALQRVQDQLQAAI